MTLREALEIKGLVESMLKNEIGSGDDDCDILSYLEHNLLSTMIVEGYPVTNHGGAYSVYDPKSGVSVCSEESDEEFKSFITAVTTEQWVKDVAARRF